MGVLIDSTALRLVTDNLREFQRIPGLQVEVWT
ncbi:MAG: type II toxin-antitoxin system VapC family toxin [Planctomycetes bacterium]|nr:type II toxin-antitoxin system VapC family toxin [Planctomycetota bacterium]MBM4082918.1 type II toxin-antitoxin system VapC family toxin [Planctomycetota bacterium]MBM4086120.1 type II toxin-antitoxin system VapC family toxin [Planctomycetota bacterium]